MLTTRFAFATNLSADLNYDQYPNECDNLPGGYTGSTAAPSNTTILLEVYLVLGLSGIEVSLGPVPNAPKVKEPSPPLDSEAVPRTRSPPEATDIDTPLGVITASTGFRIVRLMTTSPSDATGIGVPCMSFQHLQVPKWYCQLLDYHQTLGISTFHPHL